MTDPDTPTPDPSDEATDAAAAHDADRPPTDDEARAAEQALPGSDPDAVAEHYEEMAERGANVQGEGQITPS